MTVRGDMYVDWNQSPRIIWVEAPSTQLTIQDLVDTCRELEAELENTVYDHLIDAAGKDNLGGGVYVGITATLYNAQVAFEARTGPSFVQCSVAGGNLVAVDSTGVTNISPIYPTAYTQITLTSSSSATLQESADIQYSSYNGGVTVDVTSSNSGTGYPTGTPRQPVNNLADAATIASSRGFNTLYIIGDITVNGSFTLDDFTFVGQSPFDSTITVSLTSTVTNSGFKTCTVSGQLGATSYIRECHLGSVTNLSGHVEDTIVIGPVAISGDVHFISCFSSYANAPASIDLGGSGSNANFRAWSGDLILINKTGPENVDVDLVSGEVTIDSTVTAGTIDVGGTGFVNDNSIGATVITDYLVNPSTIWNEPIAGHTTAGSTGEALNNAGGASAPPNQGGM